MVCAHSASLFDRIGGKDALRQVVQKLYIRILNDPDLSAFFPSGSIEKLKHSQLAFLSVAFGAPHQYTGKSLRDAHAPLLKQGLSDVHFDRIAHYLQSILQDMGVESALVDEVMGIVESTRTDVLNR